MIPPEYYIPFLYGAIPMALFMAYGVGYKSIYIEAKHRNRAHPVEDRWMTFWEMLPRRIERVIWWRVIAAPVVVGSLTSSAYTVIRLTVEAV